MRKPSYPQLRPLKVDDEVGVYSRSLGGGVVGGPGDASSPDTAKAMLKKLITEEDKHKPLSDQKLCELMAKDGCEISRRTVAKYRDELGIPSTTGRKQYE